MSRYLDEAPSEPKPAEKTAILLLNLGTPDAPTAAAVRRYLKEFLSDPRVVELPKLLWWPVLNGIILNTRPKKSAGKYAKIWRNDGSPLKVHTERQCKLLRGLLGQAGQQVIVEYAMRYGQPSIPATLGRLKAEGCNRILLLSLYPQYAASTTATAFDAAFGWTATLRNQPEIRTIRSFAEHPSYLGALAQSVRDYWMTNGHPPKSGSYRLLMSFHGAPRDTQEKGDPYHDECLATGQRLAQELNLDASQYQICFQSRFGPGQWLQPYTAPTLTELGKQGIERVDVICPGFTADCLETLEEIAIEGKAAFLQAGGREFNYLPCLNERDDWIHALAELAETHLQGWPTQNNPPISLK